MDHSGNEHCLKWLAGLIILIGLSGCNSPSQTTFLPVTISLPSLATSKMTSTMTIIPTRLFTQTPTPVPATPISTSTATSTPTRTTEAPSPTPGPTLAETKEEALVLDLLYNNAGCKLPCWWGFTPGETTWETVRDFFLSYGANINTRYEEKRVYTAGFGLKKYSFGVSVTSFVDQGVAQVLKVYSGTSPNFGTIIYGDPFFEKAMKRYTLSQILSLLGKPTQILILVDENKDVYLPDYHFLLFYPEKGVLVEYEGRSEAQSDQLQLCPAKTVISIWLWSPKEGLALEDVFSLSAGYQPNDRKMTLGYFRSWEEVSGKSIDDFVTTFKVQNACFDTSAALWGRK